MTRWTAEAVRRAAAAWAWTPDDAETIITDVRMINYPAWLGIGLQVSWFDSDRRAEQIINDVTARAREWGRDDVHCWVTDTDRPAEMEQALLARGAALEDTVDVLALEIADGLPDFGPMPSVTAELVTTAEQRLACAKVNYADWGTSDRLGEDRLRREVSGMEAGAARGEFRVLARLDGEPVSSGGCSVIDGAARLWAGATLQSARGHGAYRAVLAERLRIARDRGATLGLVKGKIDTSGPILRRIGFTPYGQERIYRLAI